MRSTLKIRKVASRVARKAAPAVALWIALSIASLPMVQSAAAEVSTRSGTRSAIVLAQSDGKSLDEAVEQVRNQYKDGRIISAETKISGGREVHYIRVMVDGKVKTVTVNGKKRG